MATWEIIPLTSPISQSNINYINAASNVSVIKVIKILKLTEMYT